MRVLLLTVLLLLFATSCFGAKAVWDAPTGQVDGYIIYYADGTNNYSKNVGNVTEYDLEPLNLVPGTEYTFTVTAYNAAGESDHSNAVTYTKPPFVPTDSPAPMVINIPSTVMGVTINIGGK